MNRIQINFSHRQLVGGIVGILLLLVAMALAIFTNVKRGQLLDQEVASRWDEEGGFAQISCFYTDSEMMSETYFMELEHNIEAALLEASIVSENESSRLWIDGISRTGSVVLNSELGSLETKAVGVSGDFFQFHPVKLLYGSYFSDASMMQDGVIVDEDAAWKLFGSNNVVGKQVIIGGVPHFVTGVIERQSGRMWEAAGLNSSVCYLALDSLVQFGTVQSGYTYEIVMPNPIDEFAVSIVKEKQAVDETQMEVVENSKRFDFLPLCFVMKDFGIRSMNQKSIIYPYWENVARGWEDIFAVILMVQIICFIIVTILLLCWIIGLWKNKGFTGADVKEWMGNRKEQMMISIHQRKKKGKKV